VGEAPQSGAAGSHTGEQGMVDQPVGDHQALTVGQGHHRRQVGLEAAGEQQRPAPPQPGCQLRLQLHVHRPGAGDQAGPAGAHTIPGGGLLGGGDHRRVAAEAEVVVAGEVEERGYTSIKSWR